MVHWTGGYFSSAWWTFPLAEGPKRPGRRRREKAGAQMIGPGPVGWTAANYRLSEGGAVSARNRMRAYSSLTYDNSARPQLLIEKWRHLALA